MIGEILLMLEIFSILLLEMLKRSLYDIIIGISMYKFICPCSNSGIGKNSVSWSIIRNRGSRVDWDNIKC